jgi:Icc-related predicted phosphoesterase
MQKLRIGAVTDIHAGRTRSNIQSDDALEFLSEVVSRANEMSLDLFVTLGDNINATSVEEDRHYLAEVRDVLSAVKSPTVPMFGNNDVRYIAASDVGEILKCNPCSEVRKLNGWSLIFWRANCSLTIEEGLRLPDEDLQWLESALNEASYPAVVFTHVPLDNHAMTGNYYFQNRTDLAGYSNASEARRLLEASGKVVLAMAGHVHWNAGTTIGGIHYRTLASLADTFDAGGKPSRAWGIFDLNSDRLALEVFGREPCSWSAAPRSQGNRWYKPLEQKVFERRMRVLWHEAAE